MGKRLTIRDATPVTRKKEDTGTTTKRKGSGPRVIDIATGKDVTEESMKLARQREKERLSGSTGKSKIAFSTPSTPTIPTTTGWFRPLGEIVKPITPTTPPIPKSLGKEYVFEFSGPLSARSKKYIPAFVKAIGAKNAYIENNTKLVVVL